MGDKEQDRIKMGEDKQDIVGIVGQSCGMWKAKSKFV